MKANKLYWIVALVVVAGLAWNRPLMAEEAPEEAPPPIDQIAEEGPGEPPQVDNGTGAPPSEPPVLYNPDAPEQYEPAAQPQKKPVRAQANPVAPPPAQQEAAPTTEGQTAAAGQTEATEAKDFREENVFDRIKSLVKRFDAQERKGMEYPSKVVENAIRAEFMRRTEGGNGPSWLKKRSRDTDKDLALDNLELLLTYAEKLSWAPAKKKEGKDAAKEALESKMLASKAVVDKYNYRRGSLGAPDNHTTFSPTRGMSAAGKIELGRRRTLSAGLIAGDDYAPMTAKKYDDFAKRYRQALVASVVEYEKLASLVAGGTSYKPVATHEKPEKKVERKPASKPAKAEKATKKKKKRRDSDE